jgi:tripartite-type tricarboxylate transporter receptor subunit TctC
MARLFVAVALAILATVTSSSLAVAQDWPTRTVRIIIPLGPGGGGDVFSRLLAEELQ